MNDRASLSDDGIPRGRPVPARRPAPSPVDRVQVEPALDPDAVSECLELAVAIHNRVTRPDHRWLLAAIVRRLDDLARRVGCLLAACAFCWLSVSTLGRFECPKCEAVVLGRGIDAGGPPAFALDAEASRPVRRFLTGGAR